MHYLVKSGMFHLRKLRELSHFLKFIGLSIDFYINQKKRHLNGIID